LRGDSPTWTSSSTESPNEAVAWIRYISKIENEKLDFSDYPSEETIRKLAKALDGDEDELLVLAKKVPDDIKKRVMQRPDAFRKIANLDDETRDRLLEEIDDW